MGRRSTRINSPIITRESSPVLPPAPPPPPQPEASKSPEPPEALSEAEPKADNEDDTVMHKTPSESPTNTSKRKALHQSSLDAFIIDDAEEDLSIDLQTVLDNLLSDAARQKSFLGHPRMLSHVVWQETISNKCVLTQAGVDDPAVFWTIGEIDSNQYWLFADGSWNRRILGSFTNHAATACIRVPTDARLQKTFHDGIQGATRIAQFNKESGVMVGTPLLNGHRLRIRHPILREIDPAAGALESQSDIASVSTLSDGDAIQEAWESLKEEWNLENMPCSGEDSSEERRRLVENPSMRQRYELNLLPAYDIDGKPIAPPDYERNLKGATVKVMFTVSRWLITKGGDRRYVFNANVEAIWVLSRPIKAKPNTSGRAVREGNPWKRRKM
ncbi:hypothetical protein VNI00_007339 [Paramarasmius palmivorus]|uniref:Uncharacterized protein n=1 Tax=Paramarasmius palmivorus TaxID=297713 RepID=A0AAW0D666_9AGAR